jgi:hypothetical protein
MKVFVYRNLNRVGHVYSIKSLEGTSKGRVLGYASRLVIKDAELVVSQAGRNRVLKTRKKNVHAGCVGELLAVCDWTTRMHDSKANFWMIDAENWNKHFPNQILITYNPYEFSSFVIKANKQPIRKVDRVFFNGENVSISNT